jgi:hypothetical protein
VGLGRARRVLRDAPFDRLARRQAEAFVQIPKPPGDAAIEQATIADTRFKRHPVADKIGSAGRRPTPGNYSPLCGGMTRV